MSTAIPQSAAAPAEASRVWWSAALVALIGLVLYGHGLDAPFLFDGDLTLIEHPSFHRPWPLGEMPFWNRCCGAWTFQWNFWLGGPQPWGYHVVNNLIHVGCALLVFGLVRRSLLLPGASATFARSAHPLALACALVWLVHPLNTQAVTYIVQRYESLMALCYLATIYLVLRGATGSRSGLWYLAAIATCWAGAACKEVMATLPAVLLLYDRACLAPTWREVFRRRWQFYLLLCLPIGWLLWINRGSAGAEGAKWGAGFGFKDITPWQYLSSQPAVLLHYLRLTFWPDVLVLDYGWPVETSAWRIYGLGAVVLVLLGLAIGLWLRRPALGLLGLAWFLVLAPTSSFIPIVDLAYEHRLYLPLVPLVILCVLAAWWALTGWRGESPQRDRLAAVILVAVLLLLGGRTAARIDDYLHPDRLWQANIRQTPHHARPYRMLALVCRRQGRIEEAKAALEAALEREPRDAMSWIDCGSLYFQTHDYDAALARYRRGLEVNPQAALGHINIARVLMIRGDYAGAIAATRQALQAERRSAAGASQLAWLLATAPQDALRDGREALALLDAVPQNPRHIDVQWHSVRAAALAELGRFDESVVESSRALAAAESIRSPRLGELRQQLTSYRARHPWRLPVAAAGSANN